MKIVVLWLMLACSCFGANPEYFGAMGVGGFNKTTVWFTGAKKVNENLYNTSSIEITNRGNIVSNGTQSIRTGFEYLFYQKSNTTLSVKLDAGGVQGDKINFASSMGVTGTFKPWKNKNFYLVGSATALKLGGNDLTVNYRFGVGFSK